MKRAPDHILQEAIKTGEEILQSSWLVDFKRDFFDILCWKVSERFGKYNTQFRSRLGMQSQRPDLIHEHIIPRATLWELAQKGVPAADLFKHCQACIITRDEHKRLHNISERPWSWCRYIEAGIDIFDTQENRIVSVDELHAMADLSRSELFGWL